MDFLTFSKDAGERDIETGPAQPSSAARIRALRCTTTPMGISEFAYPEKLPLERKGRLPSVEEMAAELGTVEDRENGTQEGVPRP